MPQGSPLKDAFAQLDATNPEVVFRGIWYLGSPSHTVANNPFAITNTGNSALVGIVGGRPCLTITDGNSSATADLSTYRTTTAAFTPQAGKITRVRGSVRFSVLTQDIAFGLGVPGAGMIGTDPTDHLMVRKLAAVTDKFSFRCRKASGTAETFTLSMSAIAVDTWYDWEIFIRQETGATAGTGRVEVYWGAAVSGGRPLPMVGQFDVATQFPDTVAMSAFFAQRAGAVDTATTSLHLLAIEQEL